MKEQYVNESDQWIPWEISYSLKKITRADKMSHTNGILGVVLPDYYGSYSYFINESCSHCKPRQLQTHKTFKILASNMFNAKDKDSRKGRCNYCSSDFYTGNSSYIETVKWENFLSNKDHYLDEAARVRDDRSSFHTTKEI